MSSFSPLSSLSFFNFIRNGRIVLSSLANKIHFVLANPTFVGNVVLPYFAIILLVLIFLLYIVERAATIKNKKPDRLKSSRLMALKSIHRTAAKKQS
ncbi:hypothetical protein GJ496_009646 [Pomphorhynchus laevis]|nr:hypothetical protein GJ496_009646 [Pomphorhynchus laevis]